MSANDIPLDKAELLAMVLESLLYGFSLFMFGGTIWVVWAPNRATLQVKCRMFIAACLLLLFSTVHLVIDVVRVMEGFIFLRDTHPEARIGFFSDVAHWTFVSKNYLYAAQTLIGDGVVLYRCYAVWRSHPVMILPGLLWCGVAITSFACPFTEARMTQGDVFRRPLSPWITAFWASTLTTNVVTTLLLAYRIWNVDRRASRMSNNGKSELRPILHIVIDAGVVYSLTLFVALICFANHSNGQYVILDMIMPIISITFYMVIIRVGLANRANQGTHSHSSGHGSSFVGDRRSTGRGIDTVLSVDKVDNGLRSSSMSPMTPKSGESHHQQCEIRFEAFNDVEEAV